jgi:hypothetical protein
MTNRRSILSTLCTGALALLAPVVARAKPCRRVRFRNYGVKGIVITPRAETTTGPPPRSQEQEWILPKPLGKENAELRALLAEARERLREDHYLMAYDDGEPAQMGDAFRIDHGVLIARIDDALKGHERNA